LHIPNRRFRPETYLAGIPLARFLMAAAGLNMLGDGGLALAREQAQSSPWSLFFSRKQGDFQEKQGGDRGRPLFPFLARLSAPS
jgi:hypothetical protein